MSSIYLLYRNILESGTVTVTNEDTDYPKWRLHDRDIGKLFKGTGTANHIIHIDQGATIQYPVDTLIVPAGHNLSGVTLDWQYSDNDADWSDMVTQWAGAAGQFVKTWASAQTKRYWRFKLTTLSALPEIPELFIGQAIELADVLAWDFEDGKQGKVERLEALSGKPYFLAQGNEREFRHLPIRCYSSADRDLIESFLEQSRDKPFWFKDVDGSWFFMSLGDPNVGPFERPTLNRFNINLEMIQVPA